MLFTDKPFAEFHDRLAYAATRRAYRWLRRRDRHSALEFGIVANPDRLADKIRRTPEDKIRSAGFRVAIRELAHFELSAYLTAAECVHNQ